MTVKIDDHFFKHGSLKYFRGNAHLLEIATYGEKKNPIGPKAYLDPQNKVRREHLVDRVRMGHPVAINWSQTTQRDVEANGPIKVFGLGVDTAATWNYNKVSSADLRLLNLSISEGPLTRMLNQDANGARNYLSDEGADGRIVSEVWVVMEAELAEHFETSKSIEASVSGPNIRVTASGGKHGQQTITLSAGSTFAYKLHKVKDWNRGRTRIEDMEADYHGMG